MKIDRIKEWSAYLHNKFIAQVSEFLEDEQPTWMFFYFFSSVSFPSSMKIRWNFLIYENVTNENYYHNN